MQQINEGKKVIIVAHAEGSVYANRVYNLLSTNEQKSVGLIFIAPTTKSMADGSKNYITNPKDEVIKNLRYYAQTNNTF